MMPYRVSPTTDFGRLWGWASQLALRQGGLRSCGLSSMASGACRWAGALHWRCRLMDDAPARRALRLSEPARRASRGGARPFRLTRNSPRCLAIGGLPLGRARGEDGFLSDLPCERHSDTDGVHTMASFALEGFFALWAPATIA